MELLVSLAPITFEVEGLRGVVSIGGAPGQGRIREPQPKGSIGASGLGAWLESRDPLSGLLFSSGTVDAVQFPTGKFRFKGTGRGRGAWLKSRDPVSDVLLDRTGAKMQMGFRASRFQGSISQSPIRFRLRARRERRDPVPER